METVLATLVSNMYHRHLSNGANKLRHQKCIQTVASLKIKNYSLYIDWESSTPEHLRFMAIHATTGIVLKLHMFTEGKRRLLCEGLRSFRKYELVREVWGILNSVQKTHRYTKKAKPKSSSRKTAAGKRRKA